MPRPSDAADGDPAATAVRSRPDAARGVSESRWPTVGAVIAAMVLTVLLPDELRIAPTWLLLLIEGVLLVP